MDIVAASFPKRSEAVSAASALTSELHVDPDLVTVGPIEPAGSAAGRSAAEVVLLAWVSESDRPTVRDLLWRYHGRHVPFDWVVDQSTQAGLAEGANPH